MRALLDVNVLIALLDADHVRHAEATRWLSRHLAQGWASCPLTQNGCIRIMSQPAYPGALPAAQVAARLAAAAADASHLFWPDDVSLLQPGLLDWQRVLGHRQVTDLYLLALAVHHRGRFVTFDGRVAHGAVQNGVVVLFVQIGALCSENPLHDRHLRFRHFRALRISRADWCALAPAAV